MIKFKKHAGAARGEQWFTKVGESYVRYGWSYIASNNGSAFARNHGSSRVSFYIQVWNEDVCDEIVNVQIDTARTYHEAAKSARTYIRETGKAEAIVVARRQHA